SSFSSAQVTNSSQQARNKAVDSAVTTPVKFSENTPVDDSKLTNVYKVGVGDVLDIRLLNSATSRSTLYTVMDGGLIDFPIAGGAIQVAGLTVEEIYGVISNELKRRAVEEGAKISVGIRQYASHAVIITGLVGHPRTKILR